MSAANEEREEKPQAHKFEFKLCRLLPAELGAAHLVPPCPCMRLREPMKLNNPRQAQAWLPIAASCCVDLECVVAVHLDHPWIVL